jgi:hypothetical protein
LKRNLKTSNTNIKSRFTGFFLFVIVRTEHLSWWKVISQSLSHLAAASRSSWRLLQSFLGFDSFVDDAVVGEQSELNYRPISLTCISCKIMEHVITKYILNHLESNSLLYDLQHSFRHSRSCETQLLSFVQELSDKSLIYTRKRTGPRTVP